MCEEQVQMTPADSKKINLDTQLEIDYWCEKLMIPERVLRAAIKVFGDEVVDIKKQMGRHAK